MKLLAESPVTQVLRTVKEEDVNEFYKQYCHDFIRTEHLVTHGESGKEYKVLIVCLTGVEYVVVK